MIVLRHISRVKHTKLGVSTIARAWSSSSCGLVTENSFIDINSPIIYEGGEVINVNSEQYHADVFYVNYVDREVQGPFNEIVQNAVQSIVRVFASYKDTEGVDFHFAGSGIHSGNHIITAAHIVSKEKYINGEKKKKVYLKRIFYQSAVIAPFQMHDTKAPNCTFATEINESIQKLPIMVDIQGDNVKWYIENDIVVLKVEKKAPLVPALFGEPIFEGEEIHTIGYPSFLNSIQYNLRYYGKPPKPYDKVQQMFFNFDRKVLSRAAVLELPESYNTQLQTHHCNTFGGMSGGGIFVAGALRGIHIGGIAGSVNVYYPFHAKLGLILKDLFEQRPQSL